MRKKITARLANWRAYILHCLEDRLSPEDFAFARTTVLKALGDNGLKGDLEKILKESTDGPSTDQNNTRSD